MATENWQFAFDHVLKSEGGYVHHPSDPGGITNLGCTKTVWEEFCGHPVTEQDMRALQPSDVAPLYRTRYWDKVPVGWWSPPLEPEEFAAMAEEGARLGFKTHKLKARPWNIVKTVELMTQAAGPDYGIIVDPNFTFGDLHTSLRLAAQLEQYNVQAFEDPFQYLPGWHQYRDFRRHSRIPLFPHLYDSRQIMSAIRAEAADGFNTGGSVETVLINAGMAEAAGLPVWLQVVGLGLGVSGAYGTHVHSVIRNATIPSDSLHFTRENDLIHGALMPKNGLVEVPTGPGLGVELDLEAVKRYQVG